MTARRRKDGLINDANARMIAEARGRTEVELLYLLAGEIGQVAAGLLCGRSQSWASRHLNGGAGLEKNKQYMRNQRNEMKTEKLSDEVKIRMLCERLEPMFNNLADAIRESGDKVDKATRAVAAKVNTSNELNAKRR